MSYGNSEQPQMKRRAAKESAVEKATRLEQIQIGGDADGYMRVSPELYGRAALVAMQAGCAVMFGSTSDGGAVVVTVYDGGERKKLYAHSMEETEYVLEQIVAAYQP